MSLAYFNGRYVALDEPVLPIEERGHQFGDGVYEFLRVYGGRPFMLEEHMDRLYRSAALIRLEIQMSREELTDTVYELIRRSGLADSDIYLQVTRGIAPRNHPFPTTPPSVTMTIKPSYTLPPKLRDTGAEVLLLPDERWMNCHIKSLNLLPNLLAKQTAVEQSCFEAVFVRDGMVTEGSSSNVYLVRDDAIQTHPLSNLILGGIVRQAVRRMADAAGIPFVEEAFTPAQLLEADEVFLTSSGIEVVPVVKVRGEGIIGSGSPGPVSQELHRRYSALTTAR
ncbi:D-amino-acid transaminase [Paenibacillus pasadenensis]|uniref:D-amino-acid transaminase n=1 Tax=Paenibacillus pasadenensis TaxID=217090 RepID=UPI00203DB20E|nr:D-amino-acid transaminase [Paenibacillus pasadenensis]MCM3747731.1 D-amino-acid transaminase [Paenibacillus pasadenensis]